MPRKASVTAVTDRADPPAHTADTAAGSPHSSQETLMKTNVGSIDRIARVVIGLVLLGLAFTGTIGAWGWIGVVPLLTAAMGNCPLYSVLGFSTCPVKNA